MKQITLVIALLFSYMVQANSVRIKIINNSNGIMKFGNYKVDHGQACVSDAPSPGTAIINPGEQGGFYSQQACGLTGNTGYIEYIINKDGKVYQVYIGFDVPFIGSNEYEPRASYPFTIKHLSGGEGSDVYITYEISGGPQPVPPPPPILISTTGNRIITGSFSWDESAVGMPVLDGMDMATATFDIHAKAPFYLIRNSVGTGSSFYQGQAGDFSGSQRVGSVSYSVSENVLVGRKVIHYKISNLPDNVPISVFTEPMTEWQPGDNSPTKPETQNNARYMIVINEANKTSNSISYQIIGGWIVDFGTGKKEGTSSDMQALMDLAKNKVLTTGEDITMGDVFMKKGNTPLKNSQLKSNAIIKNNKEQFSNNKTNLPVQQKINVQQKVQIKN